MSIQTTKYRKNFLKNYNKCRRVPYSATTEKGGEKLMNKGKTSNSSGITLIALVVTIIVLLILARNIYSNVISERMVYLKEQQMQKKELELHKYKKKYNLLGMVFKLMELQKAGT